MTQLLNTDGLQSQSQKNIITKNYHQNVYKYFIFYTKIV